MKLNGYSAHADHNGLLDWLKVAQAHGSLQKLFLVHGEIEAAQKLAQAAQAQGVPEVYVPARGEAFAL
jgi:metallo-beta-lactamase family protein